MHAAGADFFQDRVELGFELFIHCSANHGRGGGRGLFFGVAIGSPGGELQHAGELSLGRLPADEAVPTGQPPIERRVGTGEGYAQGMHCQSDGHRLMLHEKEEIEDHRQHAHDPERHRHEEIGHYPVGVEHHCPGQQRQCRPRRAERRHACPE